jgi:adenine phosphoribosyltransferase
MSLASLVRTIPDHPRAGILFRDVTTLMKHGPAFAQSIHLLAEPYRDAGVDKVAGIEARGFIVGAALAHALGTGFVPLRKGGKLPAAAVGQDYQLEYGTDRIEMHLDAVTAGERVVVADDLIATGGTAEAAVRILQDCGARVVGCCFLVELPDLRGRGRLQALGCDVHALICFPGH